LPSHLDDGAKSPFVASVYGSRIFKFGIGVGFDHFGRSNCWAKLDGWSEGGLFFNTVKKKNPTHSWMPKISMLKLNLSKSNFLWLCSQDYNIKSIQ